MLAVGRQA